MDLKKFSFTVDGDPKGQPRVRGTVVGGFVRMYTPNTADDFKSRIRAAAVDAGLRGLLLDGPLQLDITALFARPKSHFRSNGTLKPNAPSWHTKKPDFDNVAKTIDALTSVGVWKDDCLIACATVRKQYTDTFPQTIFHIICLPENYMPPKPEFCAPTKKKL